MGILAGARILIRYENSNGVWDFQHLIGFPRIVPKSNWGSGAPPHKLLGSKISAVTDPILIKL